MAKLKKILLIFIAFKVVVFLAHFIYVSLPLNLIHFEHLAMEDIQFNDIYYTVRTTKKIETDKQLILINSGSIKSDTLFRKKLSDLINKVSHFKPKAIGLDFTFEKNINRKFDSLLKQSIDDNNVVTVINFKNKRSNIFKNKKYSIANFPGKDGETQREYYNYVIIDKDTIPSFAAAIVNANAKHSVDYLKYVTSNNGFYNILNKEEKINPENIPAIEARDILSESWNSEIEKIIRGKIIIIGHLGNEIMENEFDIEDKFRVPTNESLFNRNLTMPGAVIHANAALMMLSNNKLFTVKGWLYEFITDLILLGFLFLFYTIDHHFYLSKLLNILIILLSTIPIIFISCVYLMDVGIYYEVGSLLMQIVFLEEFLDIADGFEKKFSKIKLYEKK